MTKRTGSFRKKSRNMLKVPKSEKGKLPIARFLKKLKIGDKVVLKAFPAVQKSLYHRRFHGKVGQIIKVYGSSVCHVKILDKGKEKVIYTNPVHVRKIWSHK